MPTIGYQAKKKKSSTNLFSIIPTLPKNNYICLLRSVQRRKSLYIRMIRRSMKHYKEIAGSDTRHLVASTSMGEESWLSRLRLAWSRQSYYFVFIFYVYAYIIFKNKNALHLKQKTNHKLQYSLRRSD